MDFLTVISDDDFLVDLGDGVWLMDNHKWAVVAWDRSCSREQKYALLHSDFHWDCVDDFADDAAAQMSIRSANSERLFKMTLAERFIRFDSFIAAAVRRGVFSEVHFYCLEDSDNDFGLDQELCDEAGVVQKIHDTAESLAGLQPDIPVIFDLCL